MSNIKLDLIKSIRLDIDMTEADLSQVYSNNGLLYTVKIVKIKELLAKLVALKNQLQAVDSYFHEVKPQQNIVEAPNLPQRKEDENE